MTPKYIKINDIIKNLNKKGIVDKSEVCKNHKTQTKTQIHNHTFTQQYRQTDRLTRDLKGYQNGR